MVSKKNEGNRPSRGLQGVDERRPMTGPTHFEFLVPPQDLRAQRDIMYRTFIIVVNDVAFLILALVSRLCHRLALSLVRGGLRAYRLCQLYALQRTFPVESAIKILCAKKGVEGCSSREQTHRVDPKAGLGGDHEHASRLRMDIVARVFRHKHPTFPTGRNLPLLLRFKLWVREGGRWDRIL